MNANPDMNRILIYCDDRKHESRRVPVTNFIQTRSGWHELPPTRAGRTAGTGYTMHGESVDAPGWALDPDIESDHRVNHDLVCRKCNRPWTLTAPKLHSALKAITSIGVSEVSLVGLAAIVQMQAEL